MVSDDKLEIINNKVKKYNFLVILSYCLAIVFTLLGTISIVSLIMYLDELFELSIMTCLFLDVTLPPIYSLIVNCLIRKVDIDAENVLNEIEKLEEEYEKDLNKEEVIEKIKSKFSKLSREKQLKLLSFIKNDFLIDIDDMKDDDILLIGKQIDSIDYVFESNGYSKSRTIENERNKK